LYLLPVITAKAESLVMGIVTDVLICFPIITQRSKGMHYFHSVVGLEEINIKLIYVNASHHPSASEVTIYGAIQMLSLLLLFKNEQHCTV